MVTNNNNRNSCSIISNFNIITNSAQLMKQQTQMSKDWEECKLKSWISSYKSKYNEVSSQYQNSIAKITEYTKSATTSTESTNLIKSEYQKSNELLGLTDVKGEGIIITLKDVGENKYSSEDLRSLVNELKYARRWSDFNKQ